MLRSAAAFLLFAFAASPASSECQKRVDAVRRTPGFVALWDFVKRDAGRFSAHTAPGTTDDFRLDAVNYVREYWNEGRPATYEDFPLLGEGPFGQAVGFRAESDRTFRPCLMVPRERLHGSRLDVHGPRKSVSMIVWLRRESGNHAIAGIWHEGTDLAHSTEPSAKRVERGRRQYALFAGLAANNGASAVHVSDNGASSFGDKYARHLAVTPKVIPAEWSTVGFTFDNDRNTVTAWLNGEAQDHWIDNPQRHPFFQWAAKAWPNDYAPLERKPRSRTVISRAAGLRTEIHEYAFTRVRVTIRDNGEVVSRELVSLRVNPYWFPHDLYTPPSASDGGPFTIGRVIHVGRNVGFVGHIGGVAVFDRALSPKQMRRLMSIGRTPIPPPAR